ncbi:MAG: PKD domain-containing protein [Candidatus Cyclobacteriaceae bacterium M2_1C_046]
MKNYLSILGHLILLVTVGFLTACNEEDEILLPENELVANAGEDQAVVKNSEVLLDGSASIDGNGKSFNYLWNIKSMPDSSSAVIEKADSVKAIFTADVEGIYIIELTIAQNTGSSTDEVMITVQATDPGPGEPEPAAIFLDEDITTNTTLVDIFQDEQPDYIVTEDILVTANLTIEPGVIIAFEEDKGMGIYSEGSLIAKGVHSDKISFIGKESGKGYWKGLLINSNNENNQLDYVVIDGGGSSEYSEMYGIKGNLLLAGSSISASVIKITNSTISNSDGYGLYLAGASYLIEFGANKFEWNEFSAAYIPANQLHMIDFYTDFSEFNGYNGVMTSGVVDKDFPVQWKKLNFRYYVVGPIIIKSGIEIEPGAYFIIHPDASIQVLDEGYLNSVGTPDQKIVFTTTSMPYYWGGILVNTTSELNQFVYTEISYGGNTVFPNMMYAGNLVSEFGKMKIENSTIQHGRGYGIVVNSGHQVNQDVVQKNTFFSLPNGKIYPEVLNDPDYPSLIGEWVDGWSLNNNHLTVTDNLYDATTSTWFGGAIDPWSMEEQKGFGLKITEDGEFSWTIAERHIFAPECNSYSAEQINGKVTYNNIEMTFTQDYWRSKFVNSCDEKQNVDTEIEPFTHILRYEINKVYDMFSGEMNWELKFYNADNSTFSFYRKG